MVWYGHVRKTCRLVCSCHPSRISCAVVDQGARVSCKVVSREEEPDLRSASEAKPQTVLYDYTHIRCTVTLTIPAQRNAAAFCYGAASRCKALVAQWRERGRATYVAACTEHCCDVLCLLAHHSTAQHRPH